MPDDFARMMRRAYLAAIAYTDDQVGSLSLYLFFVSLPLPPSLALPLSPSLPLSGPLPVSDSSLLTRL
eukprot:COSAG01_NODE_15195_length_1363_cov_0.848892_4_plen_67_part_01